MQDTTLSMGGTYTRRAVLTAEGMTLTTGVDYTITLHAVPGEDAPYWIASVPALPGCHAQGLTEREAMRAIGIALVNYLDAMGAE